MENKHYCDKCNYGTDLLYNWKQHYNTTLHQTGKRKTRSDKMTDGYICDICDYKTPNKNNYLTHKLNNHSDKEKRKKEFTYFCENCDFGVFTESSYKKHLDTKKHKMKIK